MLFDPLSLSYSFPVSLLGLFACFYGGIFARRALGSPRVILDSVGRACSLVSFRRTDMRAFQVRSCITVATRYGRFFHVSFMIRELFRTRTVQYCSHMYPGGYKEMSSILSDQQRPRIWAQMRGEGGVSGVSANEHSCTQELGPCRFGGLVELLDKIICESWETILFWF